jgi:hypothetical protein
VGHTVKGVAQQSPQSTNAAQISTSHVPGLLGAAATVRDVVSLLAILIVTASAQVSPLHIAMDYGKRIYPPSSRPTPWRGVLGWCLVLLQSLPASLFGISCCKKQQYQPHAH